MKRDIGFFSSLPDVERRKVERTLVWRSFAKGETILNEKETNDDVYFIVEGNVGVLGFTESGRVISYAALEPGEFFGELAAIDKQPRSATVIANVPSVIAMLPGREFRRLIKSFPETSYAVMEKLVRVIRLSDLHIIDLGDHGVRQRICLELLRLGEPASGDPCVLHIYPTPTQQEMAVRIGSTRESVGRILSQLSHSGIVHRKSKTLHVLDRKKLEEMASSGDRRGESRRLSTEHRKAASFTGNNRRSADDRRKDNRRI